MHILPLLDGAVALGKALAPLTATTVDDQIVAILEAAVKSPELRSLIETLFDHHAPAVHALSLPPDATLAAAVGVDWNTLLARVLAAIQFLKQIIPLLA